MYVNSHKTDTKLHLCAYVSELSNLKIVKCRLHKCNKRLTYIVNSLKIITLIDIYFKVSIKICIFARI